MEFLGRSLGFRRPNRLQSATPTNEPAEDKGNTENCRQYLLSVAILGRGAMENFQ